uniref:Beta-carotene oxygenase 1 n=1 Tax=Aotus nancymaae TaxID=37293 RepID=A0A2K5E0W3_AOTNA
MEIIYGRNRKEQLEPVRAKVTGKIPAWLQGTLLRNGPGMHTVGESRYNHWFDGLALLHSFTIRDGESAHECAACAAAKDPKLTSFSYLTHTCPRFHGKLPDQHHGSVEKTSSNLRDQLHQEKSTKTLETLEKVDYRKYVAVNLATSHPHYDEAGNVLNMGTSIVEKGKTKYVIFKIPATVPEGKKKGKSSWKHTEVFCSIPSRSLLSPSYYHSFGVTENYVIFLEQPFRLDILKMATAYIRGMNWASCLAFHREEKTYIHIVDQRTRQPVQTKLYTDPMVVFHHVNAYEEDGCIVFDVIAYEDNSLYQLFYLANLNRDFQENTKLTSVPTLRRFAVPLHVDKVMASKEWWGLHPPSHFLVGLELPRVNYTHNGKRYRYVFAAGVQWSPVPTKIIKYDILTKSSLKWTETDCWPAEPLFVPVPGAKDEDDGVILSAIVSTDPQKLPFLLILDAKSFTELARASIDVDMHMDLHGLFIPDMDSEAKKQATSEEQRDRASDCRGAPPT